jgi:hypothetical protein
MQSVAPISTARFFTTLASFIQRKAFVWDKRAIPSLSHLNKGRREEVELFGAYTETDRAWELRLVAEFREGRMQKVTARLLRDQKDAKDTKVNRFEMRRVAEVPQIERRHLFGLIRSYEPGCSIATVVWDLALSQLVDQTNGVKRNTETQENDLVGEIEDM